MKNSTYFILLMFFLMASAWLQFNVAEKTQKKYHRILAWVCVVASVINFIGAWVFLELEKTHTF
jgi:uncharacterized membrane protein